MTATDAALSDILSEIKNRCGVEITGLERRRKDVVTFVVQNEAADKAVRRLLRTLNETNYAFFYSRTRLKRVAVYPGGVMTASAKAEAPPPPPPSGPPGAEERVVRVEKVNEGTQAESLDLKKNDIIVEYDGQAIQNSKQLVDAVQKKAPDETVEMTVIRDGQPFRLTLSGGLIGIHIRTVSVPKSESGR